MDKLIIENKRLNDFLDGVNNRHSYALLQIEQGSKKVEEIVSDFKYQIQQEFFDLFKSD